MPPGGRTIGIGSVGAGGKTFSSGMAQTRGGVGAVEPLTKERQSGSGTRWGNTGA